MARPVEYENLIKIGSFKEVTGTPAFVDQYLLSAHELLTDAAGGMGPSSRYLLSYDAFFLVVQAVLESNDVRTTDNKGHRTIAIQRVGADLKLTPGNSVSSRTLIIDETK